jgi:hypothetical protein
VTPPDSIDPVESKDAQGPEDVPGVPMNAGFTELPSTSDAPVGDNPWVIPGPDELALPVQPEPPGSSEQSGQNEQAAGADIGGGAESAEPELTPLGDFGGFDDFGAGQQAPPGVTEQAGSGMADEPVPPVPVVPTPPSPTPTLSPDPIPAAAPVGASPVKPVDEDEPFAELAPTVPPSGGLPETPPAPARPAGMDEGSTQGVSPKSASAGDDLAAAAIGDKDMDELADKIAKKVLSQLSEKVIQEIAWEVVPDLAEALIQKEIAEIKAKIPK